MAKVAETPLMKQYNEIKAQYPDAVLLFRVGDFYETFSEDAIRTSEILGITLTRRANGTAQYIELAGFPHHALDTYLPKLVRQGLRVAICDQLEDPKLCKGLVKRGITELVTPGVSVGDNLLNVKENNFLASIYRHKKNIGISLLDISTGEFLVGEGTVDSIEKLLTSFAPKELLFMEGTRNDVLEMVGSRYCLQQMPEWMYNIETAKEKLIKHFEVKNLRGFGIDEMTTGLIAASTILFYLEQTHHKQISHITKLIRLEGDRYVSMDAFTIRNLELLDSSNRGGVSLCSVIDKTLTPMGSRLLRRWILFPLKNPTNINERLSVVTQMFTRPDIRDVIEEQLSAIGDLERIVSKVAVGRVTPREMVQLKNSLRCIEPIKQACQQAVDCGMLQRMAERLNSCEMLCDRISRELFENAPIALNKGNVIADGVNAELDELRQLAFHSKDYLLGVQQREIEATGISSLKIGYNNVFGYYLEVRNTHKNKVPSDWIRKQTLVSAERYITNELKVYEEKILGAEERIAVIEAQLFNDLLQTTLEYISAIQTNCNELAQLDCLSGFARLSMQNRYNCPVVDDSMVVDIVSGRHPVIERQMSLGEEYIPNDVMLNNDNQQIMIITGPNMAGKSALLRQTALIVLLAQIGCYVPADSAHIGVVDKIFTRVGANDNLSVGDSTFMVEMNEAATILNNATDRSLVLFDELGRGTSTYDGISIAWAIVEYIHEHQGSNAKTLFATHYHELNDMERTYPRIKNYNVSVKEIDRKVIFLRKLVRGGSEHSFGIHVAKLAGMPQSIVNRADEILKSLEKENRRDGKEICVVQKQQQKEGIQLSMFQLDDPVLSNIRDEIVDLDINNLTPVEALMKLNEIKKIVTGRS